MNPSSPKVNGVIYATASDGLGGFYIGGSFACIGPNIGNSCNGTDDVVRNRAAHINANGSVDPSWNPDLNNDMYAITVSGSDVYLGGGFTNVGGSSHHQTQCCERYHSFPDCMGRCGGSQYCSFYGSNRAC